MTPAAMERLRALPPDELARRRHAVRVLVVSGLGLNCERETAEGFHLAGASPTIVPLGDLLDGSDGGQLEQAAILALPGGFAFGDHLGAGFVFAARIRRHLEDAVVAFLERGGLALGICNGFQTMTRLGLLPGFDGDYRTPRATLAPNERLGYRNAWVRLAAEAASPCLWTRGLATMDLPSRHGEGRFLTADPTDAARLEAAGQIALRYVDVDGRRAEQWPDNPNGSPGAVAGVCDPSGRILGLMPHPDAFLYPFQHPDWYRRQALGLPNPTEGGGLALFRNGVDAAAAAGL